MRATATINEKLRELRLMADLTERQAAELVGITAEDLIAIETGDSTPADKVEKDLCSLYGDIVLNGKPKAVTLTAREIRLITDYRNLSQELQEDLAYSIHRSAERAKVRNGTEGGL